MTVVSFISLWEVCVRQTVSEALSYERVSVARAVRLLFLLMADRLRREHPCSSILR